MSGEDHLIKHTIKTMSTRSIKIDEESKKLETREGKLGEHNRNDNGKGIWK